VSINPVVAFFSIIDFWDQFVIEFIAYVAIILEALVYIWLNLCLSASSMDDY